NGVGAAARLDDDIDAATARCRANVREPIVTREGETEGARRAHALREGETVFGRADRDHLASAGERGERGDGLPDRSDAEHRDGFAEPDRSHVVGVECGDETAAAA